MRLVWIALTAGVACSCTVSNNAGDTTGGCIQSTTYGTTRALGLSDTSTDGGAGGLGLAQSFLVTGDAGSTRAIASIALPLYLNTLTPTITGNMTLTLRQDNSGVPSSSIISGSTVLVPYSTITSTDPTLITFAFGTAQNLSVGTTYWMVLEAQYAQTASPVIKWAADDVADGNTSIYTTGVAKYETDAVPGPAGVFTAGNLGSGRELGFVVSCN